MSSIHFAERPETGFPPSTGAGEEVWQELLLGNHRFCEGRLTQYPIHSQREFLVSGERPKAVIIGCSDSRVPPELVFDQSLGDLFVIRTIGNLADAIAIGSVEYAIQRLGTHLVVVLGHDRCEAIQAACSGHKATSPNLKAIIQEIEPSVRECYRVSGGVLIRDVVERNALRVAEALCQHSAVLRRALDDGDLQIIPARYDLSSGEVVRVQSLTDYLPYMTKETAQHSA